MTRSSKRKAIAKEKKRNSNGTFAKKSRVDDEDNWRNANDCGGEDDWGDEDDSGWDEDGCDEIDLTNKNKNKNKLVWSNNAHLKKKTWTLPYWNNQKINLFR